jgi:serine/threonine protein kinase
LGSIDHPHVVSVHDLVEDACTHAIVMELVSRGSLRPCIRSGLGLAQTGRVLQDVLSGLAQLECQRIVHLDLKPDNLLVTSSGGVKIADFGVAQELGSVRDDEVQLLGGTPQYLAPEQAAGTPLGTWTDLYAVGILAFELLVGRPPFAETQDPVDVMDRHLHDRVPKVCDLLPGISLEMTEWIDRLVAKNPSDRPRSAVEAWDGLARLLTEDVGTSWRLVSGF